MVVIVKRKRQLNVVENLTYGMIVSIRESRQWRRLKLRGSIKAIEKIGCFETYELVLFNHCSNQSGPIDKEHYMHGFVDTSYGLLKKKGRATVCLSARAELSWRRRKKREKRDYVL